MQWDVVVGVDWGQKAHAYAIRRGGGEPSRGTFGSSAEAVHAWARQLREQHPTARVLIAVEEGCVSLFHALVQYEWLTIAPINPRASKSYRDSLRLSGASDDASDAELIGDFAARHPSALRPLTLEDEVTRELRVLSEHRRTLVDERTAASHTLRATLESFFPQVLEWFGGETSVPMLAFLHRWPTLEEARKATVPEIERLLRAHRCRKTKQRAEALSGHIASAVALVSDRVAIATAARFAQAKIATIETLNVQIAAYDAAIAACWSRHPDRAIFDSLPGAGATLAPRLAVAFGTDRARYESAAQMQCYSGIAPVIEASGKQRWVHARWSYPRFLHQTFHEFAAASIVRSPWARAVYQEQRRRGAGRQAAIRALAFRWIRILFRLWSDGKQYDESAHLQRLRDTGSPVLQRMAA